jgi:hypothetical protein
MAATKIDLDLQAKLASATNQIIATDAITNVKVAASAAIAFSKLAALPSAQILVGNGSSVPTAVSVSGDVTLANTGDIQLVAGAIVNADINSAAAIAFSKLASLADGNILVGNGSGVVTSVNPSGDIDVSNTGAFSINAGVIVDADINASAAIALSKLAEAVIQADGGQAFTADQSMGGFKLTNLATPVSGTDAVNKDYADGISAGLDWKSSVRVATTANITLSGAQTIDSVAAVAGDRVLVKDQTLGENNGLYVVAAGAWSRSTDADVSAEVTGGMAVFVNEGSTYADSSWALITNDPITLGTTSLSFSQISGLGQITAGAGLTKTGNTLDVGAGSGISVLSDSVAIDTAVTAALAGTQTFTGAKTFSTAPSFTAAGAPFSVSSTTVVTNLNADLLDGISSADFLRASASSNLTSGNTLTVNSGGFIDFSVSTGLKIGGTSLSASITELNELNTIIIRETPSGTIDGANTAFTLAFSPDPAGCEEVYLNGVLQEPGAGNDYTISGTAITFLTAPSSGSRLKVSYRK